MLELRLGVVVAGVLARLNDRELIVSGAGNANAKTCPVCDRTRILASMDLCTGCAQAAANEFGQDLPAIERFAGKQAAFVEWCLSHGQPNPLDRD